MSNDSPCDIGTALPPIPPERLMVAIGREIDHEREAALTYGLGVEVQTFAYPDVLAAPYHDALEAAKERLASVKGPMGCHGAFIDTVHYSPDPDVMAVARHRYSQSLEIAHEFGASFVVFHTQYNELIRIPEYPDIYHDLSMKFWPDVLDEADGLGLDIYLENMFDASPAPLVRVLEALDSPRLGACLDIAHTALHSELSLAQWIDGLAPYLRHVHLSDLRGTYDDHFALGDGILDIPESLRLLEKVPMPLTYALETGAHTSASLEYLERKGLVSLGGS